MRGTKGNALLLEQQLRRQGNSLAQEVSPLIKDMVAEWLKFYKNDVAKSTYEDAVNILKHIVPYFGNFKPANITQRTINAYKAARLEEYANPKTVAKGGEGRLVTKRTINKELSYLSSCIKWATRNGHCLPLNYQIKGFPAKHTRSQAPTVLTPRQMSKMYEVIEPHYKLLFLLMADMGLRRA